MYLRSSDLLRMSSSRRVTIILVCVDEYSVNATSYVAWCRATPAAEQSEAPRILFVSAQPMMRFIGGVFALWITHKHLI